MLNLSLKSPRNPTTTLLSNSKNSRDSQNICKCSRSLDPDTKSLTGPTAIETEGKVLHDPSDIAKSLNEHFTKESDASYEMSEREKMLSAITDFVSEKKTNDSLFKIPLIDVVYVYKQLSELSTN